MRASKRAREKIHHYNIELHTNISYVSKVIKTATE